ncbi:MAG: hypothetical protein O7J95_14290 [Planctomycetota bacterium]|nr:hypothetical protein [Planctomycetota bacterium]
MRSTIRYLGLDVHKETITIAVAEEGPGDSATLATIRNDWTSLWHELRRLGPKENLRCCCEAGRRATASTVT